MAQPVQAHLDGAVRQAQPPRDRLLGEILVVAEAQQLTVALVEALERGMEVGPLHRGDELLVLGTLFRLDLGNRVRSPARVLAEGLVADDRRQPLFAAAAVAQRGAAAPGSQQGVLSDVLGFAGIARVAVGEPNAEAMRLLPMPAFFGTRILPG